MSIPKTMQAVGIHQTGDFDVIDKFELPVPENAPGHVLVKVRRPRPAWLQICGDPELTLSAIAVPGPLRGRELHRHVLPVRLLAAVCPRRRPLAATLVLTR